MVDDQAIQDAKRRMIEAIRLDIRETARWTGRQAFSALVMKAMKSVPRHMFIEDVEPYAAYANRPAPIGHGQTISQPYIVALMTELLDLGPTDRVLEVGGGCGYQTAILAEIAEEVFSVELIHALADAATTRLTKMGYGDKVHIRQGDGYQGWPEEAPFDAIIVTAAPKQIPDALLKQLAPGGRLVIPVGREHGAQMLHLVTRADVSTSPEDEFQETAVLPVAFVPLVPQN